MDQQTHNKQASLKESFSRVKHEDNSCTTLSWKEGSHQEYADPTPEYTFTLPDLSIHPADFSAFLEKDLIEKSSLIALEAAGRLNWWTDIGLCQKLWPLATTGDGNCLLHAASLGIWGFHDRLLILRKALYSLLSSSSLSDVFYRRWRFQSSQQNRAAGLILCEDEWIKEWKSLMQMASTQPRTRHLNTESDKQSLSGSKKSEDEVSDKMSNELKDGGTSHVYESLEEIHILALAHVLRRPIIVVADTVLKDVTGEPFAPIPFGGVYLPLEFSPKDCHQSPLCLTYDAAHFSALVAMDRESFVDDSSGSSLNTSSASTTKVPTAIPLVDPNDSLLPIQFAIDPGSQVDWDKIDAEDTPQTSEGAVHTLTQSERVSLLKNYLDVLQLKPTIQAKKPEVTLPASPSKSSTLPAKLDDPVKEEIKPRSSSTCDATTRSCSPLDAYGLRKRMLKWMRLSSFRKSMSKKLRKNWQLAKRGTSFRFRRRARVINDEAGQTNDAIEVNDANSTASVHHQGIYLCARLHTEKRHDYQEEMIRNYLSTARLRFNNEKVKETNGPTVAKKITSTRSSTSSDSSTLSDNSSTSGHGTEDHYASQCVNEGCKNYGTAATSYLCSSCFSDQKEEMIKQEKRDTPVKKISDDDVAKSLEKKVFGSNEDFDKQESSNNKANSVSTTNGSIIGC